METESLICVYRRRGYRIAQYSQWDGYPEGQGTICLKFLRDVMDIEKFKAEISRRSFAPPNYIAGVIGAFDAMLYKYRVNNEQLYRACFPEFDRGTGANILEMVMNDKVGFYLEDDIDFAADSQRCEWCYVIDLDKRTFEVFKGFNETPLQEGDRFYFLEKKIFKARNGRAQYHPVKLVKSWSLDELPTEEEFLNAFKKEEEE